MHNILYLRRASVSRPARSSLKSYKSGKSGKSAQSVRSGKSTSGRFEEMPMQQIEPTENFDVAFMEVNTIIKQRLLLFYYYF